MKNYVIGTLASIILAMGALLYKSHYMVKNTLEVQYPLVAGKNEVSPKSHENPCLFLYVFFSKNNCRDCLGIIEVLNRLPTDRFIVKGVVPKDEYNNIDDILAITNATFPIESDRHFKGLIPKYSPAVVGLSKKNDLFFITPGVPGEKEYFETFLNAFYGKVYSYLITLD